MEKMLKKIVFILLLTITGGVAMAQTHFYKGNSSYSSDILYTWDGRAIDSQKKADKMEKMLKKTATAGFAAARRTAAISSTTWTVLSRCRY